MPSFSAAVVMLVTMLELKASYFPTMLVALDTSKISAWR